MFHETLKQLVTISSGSILVLVALLEKVFVTPRWKVLIVIAIVGFFICILASLQTMSAISENVTAAYPKNLRRTELGFFLIIVSPFVIAVGSLIIFVVKNLWWR